jgi:hypothetical protein
MSSYSGLNAHQRADARRIIVKGCELELRHPSSVHYTMGADRWEAISRGARIDRGQLLTRGDCSSTATWLLWNALTHAHRKLRIRDIVNGESWKAGYTGTLAEHGKRVVHDHNIKVGDLVLYGWRWPYEHVAVALGGGLVFSHGSEGGPYRLPIDYRPDRAQVRRYI